MGVGNLAEIAVLAPLGTTIEIVGIVDAKSNQSQLAGKPVVRSLDELADIDAVVVTDIARPQDTDGCLSQSWGSERLFTPEMLRIRRVGESLRTVARL